MARIDVDYMLSATEVKDLAGAVERGAKLAFQYKFNRDMVAKHCRCKTYKSSNRNQLIDPRYTVEGRHLPDRGLMNEKEYHNLYKLERDQWR